MQQKKVNNGEEVEEERGEKRKERKMLQKVPKDTAGYIFLEPFYKDTFNHICDLSQALFRVNQAEGFDSDDCKAADCRWPLGTFDANLQAIVSVLRVKLKK